MISSFLYENDIFANFEFVTFSKDLFNFVLKI